MDPVGFDGKIPLVSCFLWHPSRLWSILDSSKCVGFSPSNEIGLVSHRIHGTGIFTLPETNMAPENGWLEYDRFLLGWPIFRGELLVLGSVPTFTYIYHNFLAKCTSHGICHAFFFRQEKAELDQLCHPCTRWASWELWGPYKWRIK